MGSEHYVREIELGLRAMGLEDEVRAGVVLLQSESSVIDGFRPTAQSLPAELRLCYLRSAKARWLHARI